MLQLFLTLKVFIIFLYYFIYKLFRIEIINIKLFLIKLRKNNIFI